MRQVWIFILLPLLLAGGPSSAKERRWVFLKGCVQTPAQSIALERAVRALDEVESVINLLQVDTQDRPRYRVAAQQ